LIARGRHSFSRLARFWHRTLTAAIGHGGGCCETQRGRRRGRWSSDSSGPGPAPGQAGGHSRPCGMSPPRPASGNASPVGADRRSRIANAFYRLQATYRLKPGMTLIVQDAQVPPKPHDL